MDLLRFGPQALAALLLLATQGVSQNIPPPNLDLNALGQVALIGDFDAISVYEFPGQEQGSMNNGSTAVLSHLPQGAYEPLAYSDASIDVMCPFVLRDGTVEGMIVGGNFTSIGGTSSRSVALYNTTSQTMVALQGIQGTVSALLCDNDTSTVYVGGSFEAANSSNAIAWIADSGWANLPFLGFDAPVTSITKAPSGHVVFGGSFTGLANASLSTGAQVKRFNQTISLASADLSTQGTTASAASSNPQNIICPPNSTSSQSWLLKDQTAGYWEADLRFGFQPTKLRLWNTQQDGRGTKTFRFTALPINGIMNFTYTDPKTGKDGNCAATCNLAQNTSTGYQDFTFVNTIGMDSFRIDVSDWYGDGGGLDGVELFQDDIFAFAIDDFNEAACQSTGVASTATTTGAWYTTPSRNSVSDYLTVVVGPESVDSTNIVFEPNIPSSGNYTVIVYTPGCIQDSSCSARAIVNVTGTLTSSAGQTFSSQIFQTNDFDKYDQVYQGHIDATSSSFRPQITITASGLQDAQLMVASRVKFGYVSSTGGLNGLFEFNPNSAVVDMDFTKSAINNAGTALQQDAHILSLVTHGDTIYAAGRFSDDTLSNIMSFSNNKVVPLSGGGLNAAVNDMYGLDDYLYAGGNFSGINDGSVQGFNNAVAYHYSTQKWLALGAGLNGPVEYVEPLAMNVTDGNVENLIAFGGSFTEIQATDSYPATSVQGLAVWVPSQNNWLERLNVPRQLISGRLQAGEFLPNGTWLGAGTLSSLGTAITGAVSMQQTSGGQISISSLPVNITSSDSRSNTRKRALTDRANSTGILTGTDYRSGNLNVTILGGHFSATATNGSTINNLMFINGSNHNAVTGLGPGVDSDATFLALEAQSGILFAAGSVSGQVNGEQVDGVVLYDIAAADYRSVQPAALVGDNVVVNTIATQPGTTEVYVGGSFNSTSQQLSCQSVCMYDTSTNQWNTVGSGLDGSVSSLYWTTDKRLLAAGDLTLSGNSTNLAVYDTKAQTWSVSDVSGIPGPISSFATSDTNGDQIWISGTANNGSAYLMEINNNKNLAVPHVFGTGTTVQSMQVLRTTKDNKKNQYLDQSADMLITGKLNITGFGMASAALFNGSTMNPLILSSKADGSDGSISQFVSSTAPSLPSHSESTCPLHLATS